MATVEVLLCLVVILCLKSDQGVVEAIDCYDCVSIGGSNAACEDEFFEGLNTLHLITRKCMYAFFPADYCFKLKGIREDGTHFIVRRCSDANWGHSCGIIRYLYDDKEERIEGCLTTCWTDGCNRGASLQHFLYRRRLSIPPLVLLGLLATSLLQRLSTAELC